MDKEPGLTAENVEKSSAGEEIKKMLGEYDISPHLISLISEDEESVIEQLVRIKDLGSENLKLTMKGLRLLALIKSYQDVVVNEDIATAGSFNIREVVSSLQEEEHLRDESLWFADAAQGLFEANFAKTEAKLEESKAKCLANANVPLSTLIRTGSVLQKSLKEFGALSNPRASQAADYILDYRAKRLRFINGHINTLKGPEVLEGITLNRLSTPESET